MQVYLYDELGKRFKCPENMEDYYRGKGFKDEPTMHVPCYLDSDTPQDKPCFILGGGPSVTRDTLASLAGEYVIAINRSIEAYPDADVCLTMDNRFVNWVESGQLGENAKACWYACKRRILVGMKAHSDVCELIPRAPAFMIDPNKIYVGDTGCNSGVAALMWAVAQGWKNIVLVGLDCSSPDNKQAWHHKGYPKVGSSSCYVNHLAAFNKTLALLAKAAPEVKVSTLTPSRLAIPEYKILPPTFCFYYTPRYTVAATRLKESLDKFAYRYTYLELEESDWVTATSYKPTALLQMMETSPGPLMYVDADAVIHQRIDVAELNRLVSGHDICAHIRRRKKGELLSGTVYLSGTDRCKQIVRDWQEACKVPAGKLESNDQARLQKVLLDQPDLEVVFGELPSEYTKIYDSRDQCKINEAYIVHYQASRTYRER